MPTVRCSVSACSALKHAGDSRAVPAIGPCNEPKSGFKAPVVTQTVKARGCDSMHARVLQLFNWPGETRGKPNLAPVISCGVGRFAQTKPVLTNSAEPLASLTHAASMSGCPSQRANK